MPENELEIREAQNNVYHIARFPRVIGAPDCTHVKIESPGGENPEDFRSRKDYFSINVQAICNANLEFCNVATRWPVLHDLARRMGEVDPPLPEEINNNELQILIEEGQIPEVAEGLGGNDNIAGQLRRNLINHFLGNYNY
ncbi:hypothetical protein Zmor_023589 [Zophobas morio]|uniref:DDE Tnp4 domain-containing protein n=1 Tax=Zophobas morio TaxID=2755281 RepID=A0AA38I3H6_9CUCU|nr:hypothetical protein Zmor_023589 [Zophobas morio]